MATCKDCLHCEACTDLLEAMGYTVDGDGQNADKLCDKFKYKQQTQGVAITLTMEQWQTVADWLQYGADYHMTKRAEVLANCKDQRMAAQLVAEHETAGAKAAHACKIIEAAIYPAPPTETE